MSILRPYQRQAITAAWAAITPDTNRVAIEMATGLGKTITFAAMVDEWLSAS
jgi:superfamily II DNA or RNA helicase